MKDSQEENNTHLNSQRAELESMSNSLINNLQQMIDEQTKRAQSLASQQHSLSALPSSTPPVADIIATHSIPVILEPVAPSTPAPAPAAPAAPSAPVTQAPTPRSLPPIPKQAASHPAPRTTPPLPSSDKPDAPKPEWPWKAGKQEKKEEGFGVSTIIVILIIGFLMTVCSS